MIMYAMMSHPLEMIGVVSVIYWTYRITRWAVRTFR